MKGKSSNFIAFDIGSSKIAAIAANVDKNGQAKINSQILQYSEGFKSGFVTNMDAAENSIMTAIFALEQECDKSIKQVSVSLSGFGVKSYYINQKIKLGNQAISKQDLRKLINKALAEFKVKNAEIIHYFPLEFIIDDKQSVENPIGMHAKELACQLHIISADRLMLMNLNKCLAKCHVNISEIFLSIYASGVACLSEDEKKLGTIIIDMGSNTTSFGVFLEGQLAYADHVEIGSLDITKDIAKAFSISIAEADKLKILYGNATPSLAKNIDIKLDEKEQNRELSINSIELAKIIENRIIKIFALIKEKYDKLGIDHMLARKIVVTGGGAPLSGLSNQISAIFQKQVRIAKPELISGFAENYNPYMYATSIGMICAKTLKYQKNSFKHGQDEDFGMFKRIFLWLKENI